MRTRIIGAVRWALLILSTAAVALPQNIITTIAGTDFSYPVQPLPALDAPLGLTAAVALDSRGNLYAADSDNNLVLKLDQQGILTVVAGNGIQRFSGDGGPATSAALNYPTEVAVDAAGNLFIADNFNNRIRKVTPEGIITTVAGNGVQGYSGDGGQATSASLNYPAGVAVDATGNLFIADYGNNRIRKVTTGGAITTVAGNGISGFSGDGGAATSASMNGPSGIAVDAAGNLFVAEDLNHRIRKLTPDGIITTVAGNGIPGFLGDGGAATSASLELGLLSSGVAVDIAGNLFIADAFNNRIRKVTPEGVITTVAGNGVPGFSGDGGLATSASMNGPVGVAVDAAGNLFIADYNRVRKVMPSGVIITVAGNGTSLFGGDGSTATAAVLHAPIGLARDPAGNLFIADASNNRIRKVTPEGVITTVAGNGVPGFSGDGGPVTSASLNYPSGVAVDAAGNLFIADAFNNRIRKVTPNGLIATVAGNGSQSFSGDGACPQTPR
jgi:secreted PhoX family phosphatase